MVAIVTASVAACGASPGPTTPTPPTVVVISPSPTIAPPPTPIPATGWPSDTRPDQWRMTVDLDTFSRAGHGDNWPTTWASDGDLYAVFADGQGFSAGQPLSFGLTRIGGNSGMPGAWTGSDLPGAGDISVGWGCEGRKASSLLDVEGTLYAAVRNAGGCEVGGSLLRRSLDGGTTWEWAEWNLPEFGYPAFLQAGPGYTARRDDYVYVYSPASPSAYEASDRLWLARAPVGRVFDASWEYFAGLSADGTPRWSLRAWQRRPVLELPGRIYRPSAVYNPGIGQVLLVTMVNRSVADVDGITILTGPSPWGPWQAAYENDAFSRLWDDDRDNGTFHAQFPPKWISPDGRELFLAFSCCPDTPGYAFNVVRVALRER